MEIILNGEEEILRMKKKVYPNKDDSTKSVAYEYFGIYRKGPIKVSFFFFILFYFLFFIFF